MKTLFITVFLSRTYLYVSIRLLVMLKTVDPLLLPVTFINLMHNIILINQPAG